MQQLGALDEAEALYRRAIAIWPCQPEPNQRELGYSYHAMGSLAQARGDREEARNCYQRSLELKETHLPGHPSLAIPLNNLAALCTRSGHTERATGLYRRALHILCECLPAEHPGYSSLPRQTSPGLKTPSLIQRIEGSGSASTYCFSTRGALDVPA